ncbi:CDP-alcohol phosphatidyltransferase [Fusarium oxysporum f. sp. vasinfectum]|nr:CDP-alcohol phosphatidyltransferase [Fusarium oxysporum f. sp. vasinfectum]
MSPKTRRQAAKAQNPSSDSEPEVRSNGNGSANGVADASDDAPRENIFLFIPNIIGYARIVLAIASLYYMPLHPRTCSFLYSVSCLLDALDGYAARIYEQSTRFGAVLDMVTDRCTTACLIVFLSSAFPRWAIVFQGLIALDLASHYMHMYATLVVSGTNASHKSIDESKNWLLRLYYTNKPIQTVGAELQAGAQVNTSILAQIFPDPFSPAALELARANKMDSTVPWIIAGVSFPFMFLKQFINCVQLYNASLGLAEIDLKTRREQGLPRPKPKEA